MYTANGAACSKVRSKFMRKLRNTRPQSHCWLNKGTSGESWNTTNFLLHYPVFKNYKRYKHLLLTSRNEPTNVMTRGQFVDPCVYSNHTQFVLTRASLITLRRYSTQSGVHGSKVMIKRGEKSSFKNGARNVCLKEHCPRQVPPTTWSNESRLFWKHNNVRPAHANPLIVFYEIH